MNQVDLVAFFILFLGIVILAYPLFLLLLERATVKKSGDLLLIGVIVLLGSALIIALWAVYYASTSPDLLWPLALFTLIFRFISPLILVRAIIKWKSSDNFLSNSTGRIFTESFPGISMVYVQTIVTIRIRLSNASPAVHFFHDDIILFNYKMVSSRTVWFY